MKKTRYKNLFIHASLQFCGHIDEYFIKHTKKLVVYIVQPRLRNKQNLLRFYKNGKLIEEKKVYSSSNIFLYYFSWYIFYIYGLISFFNKNEKIFVVGGHPLTFFFMSLQKVVRQINFVYWIGDYFPDESFFIKLFEKLKKHYHDKLNYSLYLSNGINKVFNGKLVDTNNRKTVMWGVKPLKSNRKKMDFKKKSFTILFVGLIKESQGIEFLLKYLSNKKNYTLNIVGICDNKLYIKYQNLIKKYQLNNRVNFPNSFISNNDLKKLAEKSDVGIALYNIDASNPTYYTDPGKVKAYAEMNLPIIMTRVSGIAEYVNKFNAGILVSRSEKDLEESFSEIEKNYKDYLDGLSKFNNYFNYEKYYKNKFKFLEL